MRIKSFHIFLGICILEAVVYIICHFIAPESISKWQLASRYSARISFVIFFLLQIHVARKGLLPNFNQPGVRSKFLAFGINHIIHLLFLVTSKFVNQWDLKPIQRLPEILAYILIFTFTILIMLNNKSRSKSTRYAFQGMLLLASIIFFVTYIKRVFVHQSPWSDLNSFKILLVFSGIGLVISIIGLIKSNIKR